MHSGTFCTCNFHANFVMLRRSNGIHSGNKIVTWLHSKQHPPRLGSDILPIEVWVTVTYVPTFLIFYESEIAHLQRNIFIVKNYFFFLSILPEWDHIHRIQGCLIFYPKTKKKSLLKILLAYSLKSLQFFFLFLLLFQIYYNFHGKNNLNNF